MIPVRVPADTQPVFASDRIIELVAKHPLVTAEVPCPVCDEPFEAGAPVVLVFVGFSPYNRSRATGIGAAVTVHADCAGVNG